MEKDKRQIEIKEGTKVFILEHLGCSGLIGEVVEIKNGLPVSAICLKCKKQVIIDSKLISQGIFPRN